MAGRRVNRLLVGLASITVLGAAATLPFIGSLTGELVWDDRELIHNERRFHADDSVHQLLTTDFFGRTEAPFRYGYLRPLTSLSYYVTWRLVDTEAKPYRLFNLAVHTAVSLLVWIAGRRLFPDEFLGPWLAAVLFAVHPIHAESVAWISGRTDLLCALFLLPPLMLIRPGPGARLTAPAAVASMISIGLALAAKEMALAWPLATVAFAPLTRGTAWEKRWLAASCLSVTASAPYLLFRAQATDVGFGTGPEPGLALLSRLWTFFSTIARYSFELFVPTHPRPYMQNPWQESPFHPLVIIGMALVAASLWLAWRRRQNDAAMSWIIVFFLASFLPVANFIRVTGPADMGAPMAQRFLYLPSVPWCLMAMVGAVRLVKALGRFGPKLCAAAAMAVVLALLATQSARWSQVWASEFTLFKTMVEQAPEAPLPRVLLGTWNRRHGHHAEAIHHLEGAARLVTGESDAEPWGISNSLAGAWLGLGNCGRAWSSLQKALDEGRKLAAVHHNLGLYNRKCGSKFQAVASFRRAIELEPRSFRSHSALGMLLLEEDRPHEAVTHLKTAHRLAHREVQVMTALAEAYERVGKREESIATLERAVSLNSGVPEVEVPLGMLLLDENRPREAAAAFARIMEQDPNNALALKGAGMVQVRLGDTTAGRGLLERALQIAPGDLEILLRLARLEIEAARPDRAAAYLNRAQAVAPDHPAIKEARRRLGN